MKKPIKKKSLAKKSSTQAKPKVQKAARKSPKAKRVIKQQRLADKRVSEFMTVIPLTIGKEQTLAKAHEVMRSHRVRHLPVLDGGKLWGMVTDRDLHLVETFKDVDPNQVTVDEAATQDPFAVRYDATVGEVARVMADKKIGSTVVLDDDRQVIGVFTTIDALRALIA